MWIAFVLLRSKRRIIKVMRNGCRLLFSFSIAACALAALSIGLPFVGCGFGFALGLIRCQQLVSCDSVRESYIAFRFQFTGGGVPDQQTAARYLTRTPTRPRVGESA
jgi:hypothetical protein